MSVTRSHSLSIGIVGLPNCGKSTIFNALTKSGVPAENYPFCTIDKNVGVVKVPDPRLDRMAELLKSQKIVPSAMTFVDIAGLVKGASKGEGLGNQFLSHIRECNAIMYVLRAFKSEEVTHVYNKINPADDLRIVRAELILKDIETVEKKIDEIKSSSKSGQSDEVKMQLSVLEKLLEGLSEEIPAVDIKLDDDGREFTKDLWLLTDKPAFYVLNIKGGVDVPEMQDWLKELRGLVSPDDTDFFIAVDCKMEGEVDSLSEEEKKEILAMIEEYKGVEDIISMAFKRLDLISFYTGNESEANSWSIQKGATVKEAAGVIHTDLEERFVASEIVNVEKMMDLGGWNGAKEKGLIRTESADYLIQDGDYVNILATK